MANAYAISEPTKEQLRKEGNHVLDDDRNDRRNETGSVRESSEKLFGETTEVFTLDPSALTSRSDDQISEWRNKNPCGVI
jgi:hypothetical protein